MPDDPLDKGLAEAFGSEMARPAPPGLIPEQQARTPGQLGSVIGKTLSHYSVVAKLGEGGMGEVYLAEDLELKRSVALKILPPELASDPERLARFRREAESLAAISHPNIVTIFSIEHVGDLHILTMERVQGRRLDELVPEQGMPLDQLLEIGVALSDALAAAHEQGITHRDLKPANLMLTESGRLKVLDFGLAKLQREAASQSSASGESLLVTREEAIIGTVPYMSPEQIENKPVDGRSDVFSFGIVLYELATGQRPFQGESPASVMSAILKEVPKPVPDLRKDLPRELDRILSRCLEKDPADRYQIATDLQSDLRALSTSGAPAAPGLAGGWSRAVQWLVASVLVLAVGVVSWQWLMGTGSDAGPLRIIVMPFDNKGSSDDDYVAASMTDYVAGRLSSMSGLRVIPTRAARRYAGKRAVEVGEALGVDYVLDAEVRWPNTGERRVLITPQLLRVSDGTQAWGQPYNVVIRTVVGFLKVPRDIADQVANRLGITVTADPVAHGTQFTDNLDAFNEYRRGVYLNGKRGEENFSKARDCFERAVKLDDGFALAHQGIAEYWTAIAWYCLDAPRNAYPKSLVSVMKALKAAPRLPEAWADLALIYEKYEGYEKAEEAYKKAIAFAGARYPKGYPSAHHWYGGLLSTQGEHARALEQGELAQSIDPASPIITAWVGLRHYYAGDYDDAIKELDKALFLDSDIAAGHWHRSWACAQVGQHKQAIENASRAVQLSKNNPLYKVNLAWTLAMSREKQNLAEAQRLVQELAVLARTRYISGYHMAAVHVALGDKDAAFRELDRAIEDKAAWRFYLKVDPRMAPLRSERRFAELVKKLGL